MTVPVVPAEFETVAQARDYFELYRTWYDKTHWRKAESEHHDVNRAVLMHSYRQFMSRYTSALNALEQRIGSSLHSANGKALALLKMRQIFLTAWQDIPLALLHLGKDELQDAWDVRTVALQDIVDLSEKVLFAASTQSQQSNAAQSYSLTLDMGVVAPLSDVARLCRDPQIRRKAIKLLRLRPCREGLADSLLNARVCERVMQLEESASPGPVLCAADVPPYARIRTLITRFDEDGHGVTHTYIRNNRSTVLREHTILDKDL